MEPGFITQCPYGEIALRDPVWYHTYDFHEQAPDIVPEYDFRGMMDEFLLPRDMKGKSFLDIGTASGFFSFEMERRGAEVVSFDLGLDNPTDQIPYPGSPDRTAGTREFNRRFHLGYWYAHRHFRSRARAVYASVMQMPDWLGRYDVVLLGSILQHLRDPLGAIIEADKHVGRTLILCEAYFKSSDPVMRFQACPEDPRPQYWTWWLFSPAFLILALRTLGYQDIEVRGPFNLRNRPGRYLVPTVTVKGTRRG
jgi:hypothetical protein